jgi:hypothetical protein
MQVMGSIDAAAETAKAGGEEERQRREEVFIKVSARLRPFLEKEKDSRP